MGKAARERARNLEIYHKYHIKGGASQTELAEEYGVSQPLISAICRRVGAELVKELAAEMWAAKGLHVERLKHVYFEAVQAWERGKENPDAALLNAARQALDSIERVLGLKAPTQIDLTGGVDVDHEHNHTITVEHTFTIEQRRTAIASLLNCFDGDGEIIEVRDDARIERNNSAADAHPPGTNGYGPPLDDGAAP